MKEEKSSTHWPQSSHWHMQNSSALELKANEMPCLAAEILLTPGDHTMTPRASAGVIAGVGKEVESRCPRHREARELQSTVPALLTVLNTMVVLWLWGKDLMVSVPGTWRSPQGQVSCVLRAGIPMDAPQEGILQRTGSHRSEHTNSSWSCHTHPKRFAEVCHKQMTDCQTAARTRGGEVPLAPRLSQKKMVEWPLQLLCAVIIFPAIKTQETSQMPFRTSS